MFIEALFQNPFLQMALWAGLLASIASGVIGSFVVVRRIAFIAGSIAHSILGGMGFCLWMQRVHHVTWLEPMIGALFAALLSALLLGWIQLRFRQREDALIAAIWSTGMAAGVIFISLTPGSTAELMNFLFGNILWVSSKDLLSLVLLDLLVLGVVALFYRRLLALCFDEEQAALQGISVQWLYLLLLCLVALSIVLLIEIIGTILVLALLTIPATIAGLFTSRLHAMMAVACLLGALFSLCGLGTAYELNWPPGATIALLAAGAYVVTLAAKRKKFN
ncbi:MAG: metal ABC transporter permease [Verrucomicrobiota bacterium]|nr:metal ABC transporter permease [Verrucomicrobiota bacterium]